MKRTLVTILLLAGVPGLAAALGLGKIQLNSSLNQPLDARIELLSPTAEEIQSLKVGLASSEAFRRAGIDRPFSLSKLNFNIEVTDTGSDYIHVTSKDPIREPYLNFLLEASWSSGRLFREYTVLLDPPMYDPGAGRMQMEAERAPMGAEPDAGEDMQMAEEGESAPAAASGRAPAATTYSGGDYGPTVSNDTLWSIARAVRPNRSVSIQQMMLALLRANPEAFIDNNVNGLKRGHVLRMPDESEINRLNQSEALAEVKSQYAMWDEARGMMADRTTERPVSTTGDGEGEAAATGEAAGDDSELRVVTPDQGTGAGQAEGGAAQLRDDLAMANEQLQTLTAENEDLKERLTEAETIISDLKRLIALKDDELATLQQQLAESEAAAAEEETAPAEEPAAEDDAAAEEAAAPEPEPEPEPGPEAEEPATEPAGGILDTVKGIAGSLRGMVMDNLMIIGAGVGLVVLAILALIMIRRRSPAEPEGGEEIAVAGEFPEFADTGSEADTELPAGTEDDTDFNVEEPPAEEEVPGEATAGDSTVVVAPGGADETEAPASEAPAAAAPADDEEEEEDPLAEVNVFLAYEHFDQAEEFVRDAIDKQPDNLEFHSKLLEVFYASGDKAKYEEAARVLNEKTGGQGEYWDMALAMWQEMSPNRALFAEPVEGEEEARARTAAAGMVDLTADESGDSDAGLDFDLGTEAEPAGEPESSASGDDEEMLDITAGADESAPDQTTGGSDDDDILDVTAAVGLDSYEEDDKEEDKQESGAGDEENLLDVTGGESSSGDILDVSAGGDSSEDLLDVTASANLEGSEIEEDLLDVTSATGAGADRDELLEVDSGEESGSGAESQADDNSLDFDLGGLETDSGGGEEQPAKEDTGGTESSSQADDNALDFDIEIPASGTDEGDSESSAGGGDNVIDFDSASGGEESDSGLELDFDTGDSGGESDAGDDEQEYEFSLDDDEGDQGSGLSLDSGEGSSADSGEDQGMELDFTLDDDASGGSEQSGGTEEPSFELEIEEDKPDSSASQDLQVDDTMEITTGEESPDTSHVPEIDMESTVEIPRSSYGEEDDEDDDEDEDSTVFVPRSSEAAEQSAEDEIATKLDLAKAYVELGDKDSAKSILEDIIAEGNEDQRRQAQEMMNQVS